jgi:hypothetical protein
VRGIPLLVPRPNDVCAWPGRELHGKFESKDGSGVSTVENGWSGIHLQGPSGIETRDCCTLRNGTSKQNGENTFSIRTINSLFELSPEKWRSEGSWFGDWCKTNRTRAIFPKSRSHVEKHEPGKIDSALAPWISHSLILSIY